jgi:hypothetical protein
MQTPGRWWEQAHCLLLLHLLGLPRRLLVLHHQQQQQQQLLVLNITGAL